jgi:hypothetical protein
MNNGFRLAWVLVLSAAPLPAPTGFEPAWEVRSVVGLEQSAASSSDPRLTYLLDFFIDRALGNERDATNAQWLVWGNVRLASMPVQQQGASVGTLLGNLAGAVNLNANELLQSAEFQTGVEWRPGRFIWKNTTLNRVRTAGLIAGFGASGPLNPKQGVALFNAPAQAAQLFSTFPAELAAQGFTPANPPKYLAFTTPDRPQFYRQWMAGLRISTFDLKNPGNPPATYTATIGQDELVTAGMLRSAVVRFDVFYPLPVNQGGLNFIYLFGTATLRAGAALPGTAPLFLDPAQAGITPTTPGTAVLVSPGNRDYYRIGIGVDLVNALRQLKIGVAKGGS